MSFYCRVVLTGGSWLVFGYFSAVGDPLVSAAIKKQYVFVTKELEYPKGVGCPPVRTVAVKNDRVLFTDALEVH